MAWESKCGSAKQLYEALNTPVKTGDAAFGRELTVAYKNEVWQLTRFDNGAYFLDIA
jgi:hypothetical protein